MAELAHAYVSLRVSTGGMQGDVRKALTGIESDASKTGQSMGTKISSGLGSALKKSAIGIGVASGAALAAGLTKGVGRLNQIEQAEAKLSGLGNSAADVGNIMENALASVKGTSYGMEQAATIAASAVAAGIKPGKELERTLKLTGDAAAIAGVDLSAMGSIVNKVATSDMMQMDVANQLMDAGIPILQMVGKEMGVTAEEARKMASDGKISFETFQNALEQGVGGSALKMGETTQGAFQNMGAAAGRLGATLAGPFFDQAGGAFRGITDLLDDLNASAAPAMESVADWLEKAGGAASSAFEEFRASEFARDAMADLGRVFSSLSSTAGEVWPSLVKVGEALGEASQALGVSAWSAFIAALEVGAEVLSALTGPLELVANVMKAQPGLVTAAVAGWMAFKTVPMLMGKVTGAVTALKVGLAPAIANMSSFGGAWRDSMRWAGQANPQLGTAGQAMHVLGKNAGAAAKGGLSALSNALGGPLNIGLMAAAAGLAAIAIHSQRAEQQQDALRASSERLAESQRDVADALAEAGGELTGDVWEVLASQIDSTRGSMDELSGTAPGFMGWTGAGIKSATQLYGALKTSNTGMLENAMATIAATREQSKLAGESESAADALASLGLTNEDLAQRVYGSNNAYSSLRSELLGIEDGGAEAAAHMARLRGEFEKQQAALESLPDGAYDMATAIGVLADDASTAADKINAMKAALDALNGGQASAEQAAFEYADTIRDVGEALGTTAEAAGGLGSELLLDGKLNPAKENAAALRGELMELSDGFIGAAIASGDAAAEYDKAGPALDILAAKYGLTGQQVRDLAGQYGMVPDQINTIITVANDEVAKGQVLGVLQSLNGIPPGKTTRVFVNNDQARAALAATGVEITNYDAKTGMADVMVDNQQALDGTNQAWEQIDGFGAEVKTAKVDVENSGVYQGVEESKGWLGTLWDKQVVVRFKALYEGFRDMVGLNGNSTGGAWDGIRSLPGFAGGGHNGYRLPTSGPGTNITDGFTAFNKNMVPAARLDAGEWIINGRSSEKYNRELAQINAGTFPKLPGYADGGRPDAKEMLDFVHGRSSHGQSRSLEGAPYNWGGVNWGDCSGAMAAIARFAVGLAPFADRFATASQGGALLGMGFKSGRGGDGDLRMGWKNGGIGGGHTSGTLPDGTNVEMGGGRGNGQIGGGAAPASDSQFTDHAYLPIHTWGLAGVDGWDAFMPPGDSTYDPMAPGSSPGLYSSPGNSGTTSTDQPRTWSDLAAGAASQLVSGQTSDMLGVFGVPDQLPPIIQAWQMLNERPGGGPSDWDLSTAAAEVKRLDAAIKIRQQFTDEAAKAMSAMNGSEVGNALPAQVAQAESELDKQLLDLERDRMDYERAQSKLRGLLGSRAAAVAEKDLTSGNQGAQSLADALAPNAGFPDEILREFKVAYNPGGGAEQWRPMVAAALKRNGFAATQREQDLMIAQINSESGGDPNILQTVQDVNSGGNEAKGLLQVIPGTFAAHRDPELPDDRTDPWANMNAALRYYKSRYGMDLGQMWGQGHGYSTGGWIGGKGSGDTIPLVGAPGEFIVNRQAASQNRDLLEQINNGGLPQQSSGTTYNIYAFDLEDAMATTSRREAQHAQTFMGAR